MRFAIYGAGGLGGYYGARLAAAGHASKQIAQRLGLSVRTVSNHLQNAYLKLGISGREDLADALGGAGPGGADA